MDRYIGKLLDNRYEIQEVIGTGGMAVVYKALCHRLNRSVAIKILKDEMFHDAESRRRFHAESQAVAMLSHPNIVSVYDVSHTDDADYIVMELIDGITLKQYIEQKPALNWREVLHFGTQICKALEHAHSRGIIHRDIKPHNIMLLKDGSVKVADFGIARVASDQSTLTREALGSVHYISPEQAKGGKIDCRADLYSLGVVLYEMLTGRPPFDGDTPVSVAIQHINAKATMPREMNPSIPEGLEQITMRAMEADLSKRYPSASQMLQDMESFRQNPSILFAAPAVGEKQQEMPASAPVQPKPSGNRKKAVGKMPRSAVLIGVASILVALVGLGVLLAAVIGDTFTRREDVTVPNLYMEDVQSLENLYGDSFVFDVDWTEHAEVPYGKVIHQDPKAEMTVKKGAKISVTVSSGSMQSVMPNLVNYSLTDAEKILSKFDVNVSVTYESSDVYVKNNVIRTEPEFGTALEATQKVVLVVSDGDSKEMTVVPPLVGVNVEEAIALLESAELGKGNITSVASELPAGTVTFQSVEPSEEVKKGTIINLHVAQGPRVEAEKPSILVQPASVTVDVNAAAALAVSAAVSDGGTLQYEWFLSSQSGQMQSVGTGTTLNVPTNEVGSKSYCCKVTNVLDKSKSFVFTNMVTVTVKERVEPVTKTLRVAIPAGEGLATVVIKMDGYNYMTPFTVERNQDSIEVALESNGSHLVDVYVDGILTVSTTVDFT